MVAKGCFNLVYPEIENKHFSTKFQELYFFEKYVKYSKTSVGNFIMEGLDIIYENNGRRCSIGREINRVAELTRLQAFVAASKCGIELRWNKQLIMIHKFPEFHVFAPSTNQNGVNHIQLCEAYRRITNTNGQLSNLDRSRILTYRFFQAWNYLKSETIQAESLINLDNISWDEAVLEIYSRVTHFRNDVLTRILPEQIPLLHYYIQANLEEMQRTSCKLSPQQIQLLQHISQPSIEYYQSSADDLDIYDVVETFKDPNYKRERQMYLTLCQFFEYNIWHTYYYLVTNIFRFLTARQKLNLLYAFNEKCTIFDMLLVFGYGLLLIRNDLLDYYSYHMVQDACKFNFKTKREINNRLAMDFFASEFAYYVQIACEKSYVFSRRRRLAYTLNFK